MLEMKRFEERLRQRLQLERDRKEEARLKMERRTMEKKEEEEFRKIMLKKMAEDAKLEQLNAERRRFKEMVSRVLDAAPVALLLVNPRDPDACY